MINRFKSKMGSLGSIRFCSRKSPVPVPFPASFAQNVRLPEAHFRYCSRRFESGKPETISDEVDTNQVSSKFETLSFIVWINYMNDERWLFFFFFFFMNDGSVMTVMMLVCFFSW